jgi:hypothetical protein
VVLRWGQHYIPQGFRVQWAGADHVFRGASQPDLKQLPPAPTGMQVGLPVTALFSGAGEAVRYIRLVLPRGTVKQPAMVSELEIIAHWGPDQDAVTDPAPWTRLDPGEQIVYLPLIRQ